MDSQIALVIGQAITTAGVIATAYLGYKTQVLSKRVAERVEDVHVATNGMKAELERQKFIAGKAEGHAEGVADQKAASEKTS